MQLSLSVSATTGHQISLAKFSILGSFDGSSAATAVPMDYQARVRRVAQKDVRYTVILFPHDRTHGGVSTSDARCARILMYSFAA